MRVVLLVALIALFALVSARSSRTNKKASLAQAVITESDSEFFGLIAGIIGRVALKQGAKAIAGKIAGNKKEKTQSDAESMGPGDAAANFARAQVGKGYSQAARLGPNSFDCSGLVLKAYQAAGKNVPTTTSGYPGGLQRVNGNPQTGDILWKSGHVGMYVGNNQVVHAANARKGVEIRDMNYYKTYLGFSAIYRPY
jgi:cell wall-associated NlpC family hydrolase